MNRSVILTPHNNNNNNILKYTQITPIRASSVSQSQDPNIAAKISNQTSQTKQLNDEYRETVQRLKSRIKELEIRQYNYGPNQLQFDLNEEDKKKNLRGQYYDSLQTNSELRLKYENLMREKELVEQENKLLLQFIKQY